MDIAHLRGVPTKSQPLQFQIRGRFLRSGRSVSRLARASAALREMRWSRTLRRSIYGWREFWFAAVIRHFECLHWPDKRDRADAADRQQYHQCVLDRGHSRFSGSKSQRRKLRVKRSRYYGWRTHQATLSRLLGGRGGRDGAGHGAILRSITRASVKERRPAPWRRAARYGRDEHRLAVAAYPKGFSPTG